MKKKLSSFILFKLLGWKYVLTVPDYDKYIMCIAPHTTNWDLFLGKFFYWALGRKSNFLMTKEWFFWPLGPLFRSWGGIPVFRDKKTSMTDRLAETAMKLSQFHLAITPEGTRKPNPDWKKGFYYIALKAGIPIVLAGIDYQKKEIRIEKEITPSGNIDADMKEIKRYFKDFKGKHPENFTVGEID